MPEPQPRPSRNPLARSNPLAPAYICVFLFSAGEHMVHVLIPPFLDVELGATPGVVGAVLAIFAVTSLIARFPTGAIYTVDRARRMLVVGGILSAAAFAFLPLAGGPVAVGILLGVDGFGWSLATTSQLAVLVAARPEGITTASAMGWYAGFNGLGNFAAGVSAGVLADTIGIVPSLLILAAMPALATAVMALAMPWDRLRRARTPAAPGSARPTLRSAWGHLKTLSVVAWAGAMVMVYINFVSAIANGFQPLLGLAAGLSLTEIGILASCRSWGSSTVRLGSGFIFGRTDGKWMTTPLTLLSAAALFLIPSVASSFVMQIPLFLAMGIARGLLRVTGSTEAFEAVDDERSQGMVSALLFAGLDFGKLLGPLLAGFTAEAFGLEAMFRIMPVALLAVYLPLELMARRSLARRPRRAVAEEGVPESVAATDDGSV